MNSLYLWINIGIILIPLILSFNKTLLFYKKWFALFPAILITAAFFLIWDSWFTEMGIWGYNSKYVLGYYMYNLPIEEFIYFISLPYASVFIYENLKYYVGQNDTFEELSRWFTLFIFGIACSILYWYNDRLFTAFTCLLLFFILGTHLIVIKRRYMSWFYFSYIITLLPLLLIQGILTTLPIIYYSDAEITGFHVFNIPIEFFLYNLAIMTMCIGLYEWIKRIAHRRRLRLQKQSS